MTTRRVLVVDDNAMNLKLMTLLLATEDCSVTTAATAQIALDLLREEVSDLLLLDLQLPDMDGLELTRLLRADPKTASMPIIAVTAYAMRGDDAKALAAGIDAYITKPIARENFRRVVASYLSKGGHGDHQGDA